MPREAEDYRPLVHRIERRKDKLRIVVEVDLQEGLAYLDDLSTYRKRLDDYMRGLSRDVVDVLQIVADETGYETGKVKWFREDLGYGFITTRSHEDVFFHYSGIEGDGFKTVEPQQRVRFKRRQGRETIEAVEIRPEV